MNRLVYWCRAGVLIIFLLGWLLHSAFGWSHQNNFVAAIAPVNESVWEHLKLGWGGLLLFSLIEYPFIRKAVHNYFTGKAIAIIVISITILLVYYSYTSIWHRNILILDIGSFALGIILGQLTSLYIFRLPHYYTLARLGLIVLLSIQIMLVWFTFHPPKFSLFLDRPSSSYGIHSYP